MRTEGRGGKNEITSGDDPEESGTPDGHLTGLDLSGYVCHFLEPACQGFL